jgi:hypothetical protein
MGVAEAAELPHYSDIDLPLVKHMTVRLPAPFYARIVLAALTSKNSEGHIIRRWLWRGALAEGIDLKKPL